MKKLFSAFLGLAVWLSAFASTHAYDFQVDGIYYIITGDAKVGVYMGNGTYSGSVVIPSSVTYDSITYSVTSIFTCAFENCYGLTSVTIPNSVTSIGSSAFHACVNLTSVNIPNSVTSISPYVFNNCIGLTSMTIPGSVTSIGEGAFQACVGLTSVNISNGVASIGACAFWACGLTSVTIPASVTSIGQFAFHGCTHMTSVTILSDETSAQDSASSISGGLTSEAKSNSEFSIGEGAFDNSGITDITCHATTPPTIQSSTFVNYDATLHVPASSVTLYQSTDYWKEFFIQAIRDSVHTIIVNSNDEQMGTTSGSGTYKDSATVQLIAIPNSGYVFQQWNDGNTDNPRDVMVTQDSTFTAYFTLLDNVHYTLEDQGVYYVGGKVYNPRNLYIKLYYSDGRLISSGTNDIDMSNRPNGIYIVTDGKGGLLKINHHR